MTCQDLQRDLVDYVEGDLNDVRAEGIRKHLVACARCQEEVRSVQETLELAAVYRVPALSTGAGVRILVGVRERLQRTGSRGITRWVPAVGGAALVLGLALLAGVGRQTPIPPAGRADLTSLSEGADPVASASDDPLVFGAVLERLDLLEAGGSPGLKAVSSVSPVSRPVIARGSPGLDTGSLLQEYQKQHLRGGRTESLLKDLSDEEFEQVLQKVEEKLSV